MQTAADSEHGRAIRSTDEASSRPILRQHLQIFGEFVVSFAFTPGDIVKWKPIERPAYDEAVADVESGRFSPIIRDVSFSLTDFNRDIDGYNRKLEGGLHGH
jgi:hypothetical protein